MTESPPVYDGQHIDHHPARGVEDQRRYNFTIIDNEIIDNYGPIIGPIGVAIYTYLVRLSGANKSCFPSHTTIAEKVGVSRRSVQKALMVISGGDDTLQSHNLPPLIAIKKRERKDGGATSNAYQILPIRAQPPTHHVRTPHAPRAHEVDTSEQESSPSGDRLNTPAPKNDELPDGFGDWYSVYPRKKSRGDAIRAWQKIDPSPDLVARMISAVERQKLSPDWLKDDGQYIPYPATWLNRECWLDEDPIPIDQTRGPAPTEPDPYGNQMMEMIDNE